MFPATGSTMIAAGECRSTASVTAERSLYGHTTVSAALASVTPGVEGIPSVASPEPELASKPSA